MVAFLVGLGLAGFKVIAGGILGSTAIALAWGINLFLLSLIVLVEVESRLNMSWRRFKLFKWVLGLRKTNREVEESENMDSNSINTTADVASTRPRRGLVNFDLSVRGTRSGERRLDNLLSGLIPGR